MKLLFSLTFFLCSSVQANCPIGTKALMDYQQVTQELSFKESREQPICTHVQKQLKANVLIQYFYSDVLMFEHELYIPTLTIHDLPADDGQVKSIQRSETSQRIINIPVPKQKISSWRAIEMSSKRILSEGKMP